MMKKVRFALAFALVSLCTLAHAQSAQSEAEKSFERLKTLAGTWEGVVTTDPKTPAIDGKIMQVTLRVTSMGNTLMHEMTTPSRPDDPITMLYLDEGRLQLMHFCDAGNRPRMTGKLTPDGKAVEFDFLDVTGNMKYGHMHRATFSFVDATHHTEDWTFMAGERSVRAHVDLKRKP